MSYPCRSLLCLALITAACGAPSRAAGPFYETHYPPSERPGELAIGVTFRVWIPPGVSRLRGVIVHQHGCGTGACTGGATAADDLHWQALARKWECALLGPSYEQDDAQECRLWCDPRNGSRSRFLQALADLAVSSGHPELETVPWCLWGHSGGGVWVSLMMVSDPDRIVAAWMRSGSAFHTWEKSDIAVPAIPDAALAIPAMCNPGLKERDDKQFSSAWAGCLSMFREFRAKGAPIGFAPDPKTGHECGDCRYLAIPFFDACLEARLPGAPGDARLRPIDPAASWLAPLESDTAEPSAAFRGNPNDAVWLPNEPVAKAWMTYVKTGTVDDATLPPAPTEVRVETQPDGSRLVSWKAEADRESGLRQFLIERDGREIGRVPDPPVGHFGRPLFQTLSYHDTPEQPLPPMRFVDPTPLPAAPGSYRVIAVNGVELQSTPSEPGRAP